jgi:hypothetical protein
MNCEESQDLLADVAFDAPAEWVKSASRARLIAHVDGCLACQHEEERLKGFLDAWSRVTEEDSEPLSADLPRRILADAHDAKAELAPEVRRVGERTPSVCAFCHGDVSERSLVYCLTCRAPHHGSCFREHGRCSTLSCGEERYERAAPPQAAVARRRFDWRVLASAASLILCIGVGALVEQQMRVSLRATTLRVGRGLAVMEADWLQKVGVRWDPPFDADVQKHMDQLRLRGDVALAALVTRPHGALNQETLGLSSPSVDRLALSVSSRDPMVTSYPPGRRTQSSECRLHTTGLEALPVLRFDVELPGLAHDGESAWLSVFMDRRDELARRRHLASRIRGLAALAFCLLLGGIVALDRWLGRRAA